MPRRRVSTFISVLGIAALSYFLGVAVMFFQLPTSDFLGKALLGAREWYDPHNHPNAKRNAAPAAEPSSALAAESEIDRPDETFDGFTLCTYFGPNQPQAEAILMNMHREVLHRWVVPFSAAYPNPTHLTTRVPDSLVWFRNAYAYPNGDLLAIFHGRLLTGGGLARIDKDSNVLWNFPGAVHHDLDVAEDGTIYALCHRLVDKMPSGFERITTPSVLDLLVVLSPDDGRLLREPIPLLVALRDSGYAPIPEVLKWPTRRFVPPEESSAPVVDRYVDGRVLHSNSVRVLKSTLAPKFPQFKEGHLLISLRDVGTIMMLDPDSGKVEWAVQGPWYAQHDAQFLDNGNILLFDNLGSPHGSRVLEYDPRTGAFPWWYPDERQLPFYTSECGMCQRLPNGNTLIVNFEGGEVREVTREKKTVWTLRVDKLINSAKRYSTDELPFLGGDVRPRS